MMLSDWIAVMSDGQIEQLGTPFEVYNEPNNRFVASFVGMPEMNIWRADTDGERLTVEIDDTEVDLRVRDEATDANRKGRSEWEERSEDVVEVGLRPQALSLVAAGQGDFDAYLEFVEPMGENSLCYLDASVGEIRVVEDDPGGFEEQSTVGVQIDRQRGYVFDRDTGWTIARTGRSPDAGEGGPVSGRAGGDD